MSTWIPKIHLWNTRWDGICRGNWHRWRLTSPWPHSNQWNRWRPRKWWSWLYGVCSRPHSARRRQLSKYTYKHICELTSCWRGGWTAAEQWNCRLQLTSRPGSWLIPSNGGHDQAIVHATKHKSHHKKSGQDLPIWTDHLGKGCRIDIHQQRSIHLCGGHGQRTTRPLELSKGRRMPIDPTK